MTKFFSLYWLSLKVTTNMPQQTFIDDFRITVLGMESFTFKIKCLYQMMRNCSVRFCDQSMMHHVLDTLDVQKL